MTTVKHINDFKWLNLSIKQIPTPRKTRTGIPSKQFFFNCCTRWEHIVAFTKVLTIYQIYHT
jgi:hypothetical protein